MTYFEVNPGLLSRLNFIATRDILNMDAVDEFLEFYSEKISHKEGMSSRAKKEIKNWLHRKKQGFKDFIKKNIKGAPSEYYKKVKRVTVITDPRGLPEWLSKKLDDNPNYLHENEVYEVNDPLKSDQQLIGKIDHIIDYLVWYLKQNPTKSLKNTTWIQVKQGIEDWEEYLANKKGTDEVLDGEDKVLSLSGGYHWVELTDQESLDNEGARMGQCVGDYCDYVLSGTTKIYSLRDEVNKSYLTVEIDISEDGHSLNQVKKKFNKLPSTENKTHILALIKWYSDHYDVNLDNETDDLESSGVFHHNEEFHSVDDAVLVYDELVHPDTLSQEEIFGLTETFPMALTHLTDMKLVRNILNSPGVSYHNTFRYMTGLSEDQILELIKEDPPLFRSMPEKFDGSRKIIGFIKNYMISSGKFSLFYGLSKQDQKDIPFLVDILKNGKGIGDHPLYDDVFKTSGSSLLARNFDSFFPVFKGDPSKAGSYFSYIKTEHYHLFSESPEFKNFVINTVTAIGVPLYFGKDTGTFILTHDYVTDNILTILKSSGRIDFMKRFLKMEVNTKPNTRSYDIFSKNIFPAMSEIVSVNPGLFGIHGVMNNNSIISGLIAYMKEHSEFDELVLDAVRTEKLSPLSVTPSVVSNDLILGNPDIKERFIKDMMDNSDNLLSALGFPYNNKRLVLIETHAEIQQEFIRSISFKDIGYLISNSIELSGLLRVLSGNPLFQKKLSKIFSEHFNESMFYKFYGNLKGDMNQLPPKYSFVYDILFDYLNTDTTLKISALSSGFFKKTLAHILYVTEKEEEIANKIDDFWVFSSLFLSDFHRESDPAITELAVKKFLQLDSEDLTSSNRFYQSSGYFAGIILESHRIQDFLNGLVKKGELEVTGRNYRLFRDIDRSKFIE